MAPVTDTDSCHPVPSEEFVALLTNLQAELWTFLLALMPGHPDVADVLQKTNVVLWAKRETFEPGTNFRAWAFTVARFEVKGHLKSMSRRPLFVFDEEVLERLAEDASSAIVPAFSRLEALEHCLSKVRPEDRQLLEHRYQNGKSLLEYAAAHKRSVSGLSVTLFRLRSLLRRCIEETLVEKGVHP
ncbi:sigma-70 family RNA polymerase sigma factor [Luteolibacter sp. LG18]|uniref:sigma-70 family RNA polymerase sigma factor n=1 Tax=Luteolibacter sp. LG18 TaxID=2819286 RepID=UPI002B28D43D|nr:DNA-directed RNA polymerase sigma-70 factor [Luteolibacter sp. LG18]